MNASKKLMVVSGFILLMIIATVVGFYFWKLAPLKSEVDSKKQQLESEEQIVAALQSQATPADDTAFETTVELQKKVPVKSLVQQLMLDIEKAEIVSHSFVKTINVVEEELQEEEADTEDGSEAETEDNSEADAGEENSVANEEDGQIEERESGDGIAEDLLPAGLQKVTFTMSVQSPEYTNLEAFLSSLESMRRIVTVDNLTFMGKEEVSRVDQVVESLNYNVVISAYFAPVLQDLHKDLPRIDSKQPAGKKNPFYQSPDITSAKPKKE